MLSLTFSALLFAAAPDAPLSAAPPSIGTPVPVGLGPQGFYLGTPESGFQLRLRGVVQADHRGYIDASNPPLIDNFLIRRARPIIEGTVAQVIDFRLLPEFGLGKVQILEAWLDFRVRSWLSLEAGKFKSPYGLERLQQELALLFMERGLTSNLTPDRDLGAYAHGTIGNDEIQYAVGIVDGAGDTQAIDGDVDSAKDLVARVFVHPLRRLPIDFLSPLGVGAAVTYGREFGNPTNTELSPYVSDGQATIFSYLSSSTNPANTVYAHGAHTRTSIQANYYYRRVGGYFEWMWASQALQKGATTGTLVHHAWQVAASVVLAGGHASYDGIVPWTPFNVTLRQFGALELAGRYGQIRFDPSSFSAFADPTQSVSGADAWAVGLNWYVSRNAKLAINYERTHYFGGAPGGDRQPENAIFQRVQVSF